MNNLYFWVLFWLVCGLLTAVIGTHKGRPVGQEFVMGFLLGPIGVIFALWQKPPSAVPPVLRSVSCPRCGAVQSIGVHWPEYSCRECGLAVMSR